jgi:O-antigen/teichoic acid export membrane protein
LLALIGLIRMPLVIGSLGISKFAGYSAALGLWAVVAAIGESSRANARQVTSDKGIANFDTTQAFTSTLLLSVVTIAISGFIIVSGNPHSQLVDMKALSCFALGAILYPFFAIRIGIREGLGKFSWFQISTITSQLLSLATCLVFIPFHDSFLFAISFVVPALLPGLYATLKSRGEIAGKPKIFRRRVGLLPEAQAFKFSVISVSETIAFTLDPAIVLGTVGAIASAQFALTQKFCVAFAIVPMVLAPVIAVSNSSRYSKSSVKRFQRIQGLTALVIGAGLLVASPMLFDIFSHGALAMDYQILFFGCLNGVVGSYLSPILQAKIQKGVLSRRSVAAAIYAVASIALSFLFAKLVGAPGPFLASSVTLTAYVLFMSGGKSSRTKPK